MPLRDWKAVAAAALLACIGAQAQPVYKWVDAEGRTHYGGQPPASQKDAPTAPAKTASTSPLLRSENSSASVVAGRSVDVGKKSPMKSA